MPMPRVETGPYAVADEVYWRRVKNGRIQDITMND